MLDKMTKEDNRLEECIGGWCFYHSHLDHALLGAVNGRNSLTFILVWDFERLMALLAFI